MSFIHVQHQQQTIDRIKIKLYLKSNAHPERITLSGAYSFIETVHPIEWFVLANVVHDFNQKVVIRWRMSFSCSFDMNSRRRIFFYK